MADDNDEWQRLANAMPEGQTGAITPLVNGHQYLCSDPLCNEAGAYLYKGQPYCYEHASANEGWDIAHPDEEETNGGK